MIIATYSIYVVLSAAVLTWVGIAFSHNADALFDRSSGDRRSAAAAHMLAIAFYLVNGGLVLWNLPSDSRIDQPRQVFEVLAGKLGTVLFITGLLHLILAGYLAQRRRTAARPATFSNLQERESPIRRVS